MKKITTIFTMVLLAGLSWQMNAQNGGGPVNDDCAGAIAVACDETVTGSTANATDSGSNAAPDVWYSYSGGAGTITASLCDGGTDYDSLLRVFDACGGTEVATNDDFCGLQSQVSFEADGTSTYYIMVEAFGTGSGNFSMAITCVPAAGGDFTCGDVFVDSGGLSADGDDPAVTGYQNNEDITYTIVPDTAGEVVTITFTYVDIETTTGAGSDGTGCWDYLTVYDGPDTSSPVLAAALCGEESGDGSVSGTPESVLNIGDSFTSTHPSGALTWVFKSDASVQQTGWNADVTCAAPEPDCNVVENLVVSNIADISADVSWDNDPTAAEGYQVVVFDAGTDDAVYVSALLPQGTAMDTATGLSPESMYEARVTTICQLGPNVLAFTERVPFTTMALGLADSAIVGYTISPNPAKNSINLNAAFSIENVIVSNVLGQQVMTNKGGSAALTLDISNLQVGTYFMKATVNGIDVVERFIKQ